MFTPGNRAQYWQRLGAETSERYFVSSRMGRLRFGMETFAHLAFKLAFSERRTQSFFRWLILII